MSCWGRFYELIERESSRIGSWSWKVEDLDCNLVTMEWNALALDVVF